MTRNWSPGRISARSVVMFSKVLQSSVVTARKDTGAAGRGSRPSQRRSSRVLGGAVGRLPGGNRGMQLACAQVGRPS